MELEIGELQLTFDGTACPPHRAADITRRAMNSLQALFREDLHVLASAAGAHLAIVDARPVQIDLSHSSNQEVASLVARAIYSGLLEQLKV